MIGHIAVVIPARDEEDRIESCLRSVVASSQRCSVPASITLVADACSDSTVERARAIAGVRVVEINQANVGSARRIGIDLALRETALPPRAVWIANTDADSVVPVNWLESQLLAANAGCDVLVGTVRPDPREYPRDRQVEWRATHVAGQPNGHVHGANLGVRASAYLTVGGYDDLCEHEDVGLVARLRDFVTMASDDAEVITSARLSGRTPGGYAGYLRAQLSG